MKGFYVEDIQHIIYKDTLYYSHNPCIVRLKDKSILFSFRRAPQRKPYSSHIDSETVEFLWHMAIEDLHIGSKVALVRITVIPGILKMRLLFVLTVNTDPSSIQVEDDTIMTSFYTHTCKLTDKENPGLFTHIHGKRYIVFVRFNV